MLSRQFDPLLTDLLVYAALNVGVNEHGCGSVLNGFYQVMRFISSKLLFSIFLHFLSYLFLRYFDLIMGPSFVEEFHFVQG